MNDSTRYETWGQQLRLPWIGAKGREILGGFIRVLGDWAIDWGTQSALEHLPEFASAASNALTASERQIVPGPTETAASLARRLARAVRQWQYAGTPLGLLLALFYAEFTGAVLVQQNGRGHSLSGAPDLDDPTAAHVVTTLAANPMLSPPHAWWTFDGDDSYCSRFAVLFPSTAPDPQLGVAANLARIQRVIRLWRPAKAKCVGIYHCGAGKFVGWPVRQANDGGTVGPSTVTFYAAE